MTAVNLGLALLADGQGHAAKSQYRRAVALARRLPVTEARQNTHLFNNNPGCRGEVPGQFTTSITGSAPKATRPT